MRTWTQTFSKILYSAALVPCYHFCAFSFQRLWLYDLFYVVMLANFWKRRHRSVYGSHVLGWKAHLQVLPFQYPFLTALLPCGSVWFSRSVVSDSLWPHESQHARPPCPSPTPGVHSNSRPSSWWCHPAISSSVVPFSPCPQSLPASESFPMSQLFAWGGQSTGVSALASLLPKNTQDWSPLEWTGWISVTLKK